MSSVSFVIDFNSKDHKVPLISHSCSNQYAFGLPRLQQHEQQYSAGDDSFSQRRWNFSA